MHPFSTISMQKINVDVLTIKTSAAVRQQNDVEAQLAEHSKQEMKSMWLRVRKWQRLF